MEDSTNTLREYLEIDPKESFNEATESVGAKGAVIGAAVLADYLKYKNKIRLDKSTKLPRLGAAAGLAGIAYDIATSPEYTKKVFGTDNPTVVQYFSGGVGNVLDGLALGFLNDDYKNDTVKQMDDYYSGKLKEVKKWWDK